MTPPADKFGFTPEDTGFWPINRDTWIKVGTSGEGNFLYQKIADGYPMPIVVESRNYVPCLNYRQFREVQEKKPWEEIVAGLNIKGDGLK